MSRNNKSKIVYIKIDKLVIDPCNVRGGVFDYDDEFIQSVKQHGIHLPLLVRPLPRRNGEDVKYGIVCGSRRYHAALEAGLDEVPCIIKHMDDLEAMGASLEENIMRRDIPLWQIIEQVGRMERKLNELKWNRTEFKLVENRYKEISKMTSLKKDKVREYVRLYLFLPEEVKSLIKPREDRTIEEEEILCRIIYRTKSPSGTLNLFKAKLILEYLRDFPIEKQVEAAAYIIPKTNEMAEKIIKTLKEHPEVSNMWDIERMVRGESLNIYPRTIRFDKEVFKALEKACLHKQKKLNDLVIEIIREWLKRNLYI